MQKITPVGQKLIVFPLPKETLTTENNIVVMDNELDNGEIIEVSDELKDLYKPGDVVIYPSGAGLTIHYNKKACLWITSNLDIWGILTDEKE